METQPGVRTLVVVALSALALPGFSAVVKPRDDVPYPYVAEDYYPAPHGGWVGGWSESYAKAQALVEEMTLVEKTNITAGTGFYMGSAPRLGFPNLCLQDGAHGVRLVDNVTAFPPGITAGATWDKDLTYQRAVALGKEFRGKGANVYLGPTVGPIGRKPRGGRNWEGFGADPVLQGKLGAVTVKGVQEQGVIATIKHLVGNEQEMYRMYNSIMPGYSANIGMKWHRTVDDRTMHELYLWPFGDAVKAGVGSVMTAYNAVNGSASSQNSYLINGLLKDELGFQGFVMSDWLSHISGVASAIAGLDMDMPGDTQIPFFGTSFWMYELTRSALNGSVPMDRINDMATRIVAAWYQMGQDQDFPEPNFSSNTFDATGSLYPAALLSPSGVVNQFVNVQDGHYLTARQVAQDAITMLKNDDDLLPLDVDQPLKIFGTGAHTNPDGPNACTDRSCNKGTLGMGWGSQTVEYPYLDSPIDAIDGRAGDVEYYNTDSFPSVDTPTDDDVAIVFISSDAGENSYTVEGNHGDRDADGLKAWHNGDELVQAAADKYSNVVVVAHTVGPLTLEDWIDLPSVKAVLFAHLPGQEAGESLANILFGDVSPSGHLPYTIPASEDDYLGYFDLAGMDFLDFGQIQDTYAEELYIDYRFLNLENTKPRYAFGHGLSYAEFELGNATIDTVAHISSEYPDTRPGKEDTPVYSSEPPGAEEVVKPDNFDAIWRYLYSWLDDEADAEAAIADGESSEYPYPDGYSEVQTAAPRAGGGEDGNPDLWEAIYAVSVQVTNVGASGYSGRSVVQAYLQYPDGIDYETPMIQLRDFAKTGTLGPGETETVELELTRRDLSVWDVVVQDWKMFPDRGYKVWIGEASDNLGLVCLTAYGTCDEGEESPVRLLNEDAGTALQIHRHLEHMNLGIPEASQARDATTNRSAPGPSGQEDTPAHLEDNRKEPARRKVLLLPTDPPTDSFQAIATVDSIPVEPHRHVSSHHNYVTDIRPRPTHLDNEQPGVRGSWITSAIRAAAHYGGELQVEEEKTVWVREQDEDGEGEEDDQAKDGEGEEEVGC
ncbi:hypothetical protein MKZ38_000623 [Zalerion maritima]|uniref:beta-glucosidase n=1 Tax=Zalerion maritima TaxID=339359 RepID=A0AAD5WUB8_9PEZI|nr:hypothetical protein MKZ38_000623 [Zalerion maritima]